MQITAIVDATQEYPEVRGCLYTRMMTQNTVIKRQIDLLRQQNVNRIIVLTGSERETVERHIAHRGVTCLYLDDWKESTADRWMRGLSLAEDSERILIIPGNLPLISADLFRQMILAEVDLLIPAGTEGWKLYSISGSMASQIRKDDLRELETGWLAARRCSVGTIPCGDGDMGAPIDCEEALEAAIREEEARMESKDIACSAKLMISRGEGFFGPGVARFFTSIDEKGSMSAACKAMEMSYSRGWKLVKNVEDHTGFAFLERQSGGKGKGCSKLTPRGREFLEAYYDMEAEMKRLSQELFQQYFGDRF